MKIGDKSMKARLGWLCLAFIVSLALAGCGSNNSSAATITISPPSAIVLLNTSVQFVPNVVGSSNAVQWSVDGVPNGNATLGTISAGGLYTAPLTRPVSASGAAVPIVFAMANASIPNSGSLGAVIELKRGSNFANFSPGNTITITGNSVPGWDGSSVIVAAALLQNGNLGVQITTPPGPPANGLGGTATATPNLTITAQVQGTSAVSSATVTLDSGIRVSLAQPTCTIGTNEQFPFNSFVGVSGTANQAVTWSLSGAGTLDTSSGLYTAPATTGTATVTATSVADPTETGSATLTIVTAADPTLASVGPPTGALGATSQNVYLSGSNFICTTAVFVNNGVNNIPLPASSLFSLSSSSFLVVLPDSVLSTLPSSGSTVPLTFTVERQGGTPQPCSPSPCQLILSPVRPAVVAATPDSIPSPSGSGAFNVTLDGGYFGTTSTTAGVQGNTVVNVQFNGQANPAFTFNSDRQLVLAVPSSSVSAGPGLYPVTVTNKVSGSVNGSMAAVNLAVQPPASSPPTPIGSPITVGTAPSSVAINTATGIAVVTNRGSNDITLVNLASGAAVTSSLCTGTLGSASGPGCVTTAPVSVAVDNIRNLALVANSANATLAVINISVPTAPTVTALVTFPSADPNGIPFFLTPQAVAINPVSGRALVAFTTNISGPDGSNAGAILDMNQLQATVGSVKLPPAVINVVNINNGVNPHIAMSPRLNWALATPGGAGSLSVVDLGRQVTNAVTGVSCNANVVSVGTSGPPSLQAGQPVLLTGVANSSFDGIFSTIAVSNTGFQFEQVGCNGSSPAGGSAAYANPIASLATNLNVRGVSINDETQKALLVDPTGGVPVFVFNILDQTSALAQNSPPTNNVATAMNPLTNIGVVVNQGSNQGFLVDPTTPTVVPGSTFITGASPVDVAIDPASNIAVIVNQGANSVSLFSLGALRSAPQIIQSSFAPAGSTQTSSRVTIASTLESSAVAQNQTVTLVGKFTGTSVPRLDGDPSPIQIVSLSPSGCGTAPNICRQITATLSGSALATNGPRLYALDVMDSSTGISNAAPLQVIQAVSLVTSDCSNPAPQGVAIDAVHNVAVVTEPGCGDVSMINLATGTGFGASPELAVGTNSQSDPQGVAVYPQAGLAVVANAGNNNVSILDIANDKVPTTFTTDPIPQGVAVDPGTGKAVVTANGASVVDAFPVSATAQTPTTIGVQQGPSGVAIDPKDHVAVVANSSSNTASIVDLTSNTTANTSNPITFPQGVAFDPQSDTFLITSGAANQVIALNPNTVSTSAIRVGINPSSIAYNFESGTLVTANSLSGTMTVVDFIDQTVRGLFSLPSSTQFAVDIHPQTNLAVVADPVDNQLLLVPLPH